MVFLAAAAISLARAVASVTVSGMRLAVTGLGITLLLGLSLALLRAGWWTPPAVEAAIAAHAAFACSAGYLCW